IEIGPREIGELFDVSARHGNPEQAPERADLAIEPAWRSLDPEAIAEPVRSERRVDERAGVTETAHEIVVGIAVHDRRPGLADEKDTWRDMRVVARDVAKNATALVERGADDLAIRDHTRNTFDR